MFFYGSLLGGGGFIRAFSGKRLHSPPFAPDFPASEVEAESQVDEVVPLDDGKRARVVDIP
jgi:hypothetical protein